MMRILLGLLVVVWWLVLSVVVVVSPLVVLLSLQCAHLALVTLCVMLAAVYHAFLILSNTISQLENFIG